MTDFYANNELFIQVYNEWATADQRHSMVAEFYGSEFTLFKVLSSA